MRYSTLSLFLIGICFQFLQGCATMVTMAPQPSPDQEIVYVKGEEHIVSQKDNILSVGLLNRERDPSVKPKFLVSLCNMTDKPINFSTENITAKVNGDDLKVYTYKELERIARQQYALRMFFVGLSGAARSLNAADAGYQYHSGSVSSNYYGVGGYSWGTATYSGVTYDAGAAHMAQMQVQAQTNAEMAQVASQYRDMISNLDATILQKTTVQPETTFGGIVVIENTKCPKKNESNRVDLIVNLDGETHEFTFIETKQEATKKAKTIRKK